MVEERCDICEFALVKFHNFCQDLGQVLWFGLFDLEVMKTVIMEMWFELQVQVPSNLFGHNKWKTPFSGKILLGTRSSLIMEENHENRKKKPRYARCNWRSSYFEILNFK